MAAARADIRKHSTMLLTASQAYLRHPDVPAARENRDYVIKSLEEAMNTISHVSQATGDSAPDGNIEGTGELIAALDELDVSVNDYDLKADADISKIILLSFTECCVGPGWVCMCHVCILKRLS